MKIYTSYYGNYRNFGDLIPVSISIWPPKDYTGLKYPKVVPTREMLKDYKATGNTQNYKVHYWYDVLKQYTPQEIVSDIERMTENKDCVLLCFEKPSDFCHRHLLATWLNKNGYDIKELE